MSLFSRLFSRGAGEDGPSDHPLGSDKNVRALIAELDRRSPSRYLVAITDWLNEVARVEQYLGTEVAHRALAQLDDCGHAAVADLLDRYLLSLERKSMDDVAWSALHGHATALFSAYATILGRLVPLVRSDADKTQAARSGAAAFRAWSLQNKLRHFRYRPPAAATWKDAHALLSLLLKHQLERVFAVPYPGESAVTPLHEYLIGLYAECLPAGNLTALQMETLDRFLRSCDSLEFSSELREDSSHRIDLATAAGPRAAKDGDKGGPSVRFCSTVKLHKSLIELADRLAAGRDIPHWLSAIPLSPELKEAGIRTVALHWSANPPHRSADRQGGSFELRVVMGFDKAARRVALSQQVRAYARTLAATQQREVASQRFVTTKYGDVPVLDDPTTASPYIFDPDPKPPETAIDMLSRIEADGNPVDTEIWHELDASATGLGATLPALLPRHCVGTLIALRSSQGLEWRPAIIRRIGHDAANRPSIGVETLGAEPICAQARLIDSGRAGTDGAAGASGWSDIIVFKAERNEVLLPPGSFATGKQIDIRGEEGSWPVRLQALVERGADYDRATYVPADVRGE